MKYERLGNKLTASAVSGIQKSITVVSDAVTALLPANTDFSMGNSRFFTCLLKNIATGAVNSIVSIRHV
jgi:hypothetical protein